MKWEPVRLAIRLPASMRRVLEVDCYLVRNSGLIDVDTQGEFTSDDLDAMSSEGIAFEWCEKRHDGSCSLWFSSDIWPSGNEENDK